MTESVLKQVPNGQIVTTQNSPLEDAIAQTDLFSKITKMQKDVADMQQNGALAQANVTKPVENTPLNNAFLNLSPEAQQEALVKGNALRQQQSQDRQVAEYFGINDKGEVYNKLNGVAYTKDSATGENLRQAILRNSGNGALTDAGNAVVTKSKQPDDTDTALTKAHAPDDIDRALDAISNGSGALSSNDLTTLKNQMAGITFDKFSKLGSSLSSLGGSADIMQMAGNIIEGVSVDGMVKLYLEGYKGLSDPDGKMQAGLSHKIYQLASDEHIHPAIAAQIVFQSVKSKDWKDWANPGTTSVSDELTSVDKDIDARVKALKTDSDVINKTLRSVLRLRQQQNIVDNYAKQLTDSTSAYENNASWLSQYDPATTPWYKDKSDILDRHVSHNKILGRQYLEALKNYRDLTL